MHWNSIDGWFSHLDAQFVESICWNIRNGCVVEIGLFAGRSTAIMAPICIKNNSEYHAIDNFCGSSTPTDEATVEQQSRNMREEFDNNMSLCGIADGIVVHVGDSSAAALEFNDNSVDFCFIDADHLPEAVQKDIDAWWPKIKKGGIIGGHDYQSPLRHVVNYFAQANNTVVMTGGKCWAVKKG